MIVVHNDARTPALPLPMQTLTTWAMTEEQPHGAKVGVLDPYFVSKYCCEHGVRTADRGRQQRKEGRRDIPKTTPTRQMFHPLSDAWPHVILLIRQSR